MLIENLKRSNNIKKIKNIMIKENSTLSENTKIIFWKERRYKNSMNKNIFRKI